MLRKHGIEAAHIDTRVQAQILLKEPAGVREKGAACRLAAMPDCSRGKEGVSFKTRDRVVGAVEMWAGTEQGVNRYGRNRE